MLKKSNMLQKRFLAKLNSYIIFILFTIVIGALVGASYFMIDYFRKEEIKRIELFATAMKHQQEGFLQDPVALDLILQISKSNTSVPVIITDEYGKILGEEYMRNIPEDIAKNPQKLQQLLAKMKSGYKPFEIQLPDTKQYVYFTNSKLFNYIKYSPFLLGFFILSYIIFTYLFLQTLKKTDEGFLWAGLAKETAHQIGTPLSSMIGWIEILRVENENSEGVNEIEKDIQRLKIISERFSKIGSVPELNDFNLKETLQINFDYLKSRVSKKVNFNLHLPKTETLIPHNKILLSWVIENLVKNAVDAMKGCGKLDISLYEKNKKIIIDFQDSGSGMNASTARNVFNPGFSTKKRGWGLGLSLAKRVINEYHNGDIKIAHTEIGKGTKFRILLNS